MADKRHVRAGAGVPLGRRHFGDAVQDPDRDGFASIGHGKSLGAFRAPPQGAYTGGMSWGL